MLGTATTERTRVHHEIEWTMVHYKIRPNGIRQSGKTPTPALRALKQNQKPHPYSPPSYVLARENLRQRNTAHRCLNRLLHRVSCVAVVHLLPSVALHSKVSHFAFRARAQSQSSSNPARASLHTWVSGANLTCVCITGLSIPELIGSAHSVANAWQNHYTKHTKLKTLKWRHY